MIDPLISSELRRIELRTKRALSSDLMGQYRSAFRGSGLVFSDLREYQNGDDIKHIHWKVTARSGKTYVKSYEEERTLRILIALDISNSTNFGAIKSKHKAALEFSVIIALLAKMGGDAVGLLTFSDKIEDYTPPSRNRSQVHNIIRQLHTPKSLAPKTDLNPALNYILERERRSSIIFIISDFISPSYEESLKRLSIKHDVICVMLDNLFDQQLPSAGIVEFVDGESDKRVLIDTSQKNFSEILEKLHHRKLKAWEERCHNVGADTMKIRDKPIQPLISLMHRRASRQR